MNTIQPIGSFFELDENGFVLNPCKPPLPGSAAYELLSELVEWICEELGLHCHSIWLRGSLAKGSRIEALGDIDIFVLVKKEGIRWQALAGVEQWEASISKRFGREIPLECQLESYSGVPSRLRSKIAMLIATQSVCLWGENIQPQLRMYKPSREMMLDYRWLAEDIADCLARIDSKMLLDTGAFCSLMKTIIRTGFELVMERKGLYTRDLYPSWQTFSEFYPEKGVEMKQALIWFLNPQPAPEILKAYLLDFGQWLIQQVNDLSHL